MPAVERAVGLGFTSHAPVGHADPGTGPRLPHREARPGASAGALRGLETAYRLLASFRIRSQLAPLLLDLYSEQVAGYYDPDSATLFGVAGADPAPAPAGARARDGPCAAGTVPAARLDPARHPQQRPPHRGPGGARGPGHPGVDRGALARRGRAQSPEFWDEYRDQVPSSRPMPVFARRAPAGRETLLFPYLDGAEFMRWWGTSRARDSLPYGRRMPASTEQILLPTATPGATPVPVAFPPESDVALRGRAGRERDPGAAGAPGRLR